MLPTGTVTFLITDIEGSTRLWETHHDEMQLALARHDEILRDAIDANGGFLIKTTGDGAHAVFATAPEAIAASLAAQRELAAAAWGDLRIKSRMALHTGTAELREGDYYGPVLNRAARLMAAGHGGQILLSLATEELARDHLPVGIVLRDLGERRLKDLIRPERVYQLIAPDLPHEFPALKTLDGRPHNLPAQTTPFIGRESANSAVKKLLSDAHVRLLTLSGVGGTGKTRLALQAAADLVDEFEDGVFYVPLAALGEPDLVLQAIAQVFAVREAGKSLMEHLQDHLRGKQLLLVLDNFEQVIEAATIVSELLSAAPRLKVLATSRELLHLTGENNYPVPPLSVPDPKRSNSLAQLTQYEAVALFIDRAVAAKSSFAVTNDNAPAIAEICFQLDGLPLAIELAAARVRMFPAQRMLAEMSHRLSFLKGGARDRPTRQKTLRGAIDWSHDLLGEEEQKVFRQLGAFVGGCTLDAVAAVCEIEPEGSTFEIIESLAAKSLLRQTEAHGEVRFGMLETIREYACEKLTASGDEAIVRARHRDHFLALTETADSQLSGSDQLQWLRRLEEEHENLRAGLNWSLTSLDWDAGLRLCGALQRYWWTLGHFTEGREWCARFLKMTEGEEETLARARVLNATGVLAFYQGDHDAARARHEESLAIRRRLGDQTGTAASLGNLGTLARARGDTLSAQALHQESLDIRRQVGNRGSIARSLNNLGNVALDRGDYPLARQLLEECLAIMQELADKWSIGNTLSNLGDVAYAEHDYPTSRTLHEGCLAIMQELGERRTVANSLCKLGDVLCQLGDYDRADKSYLDSLAARRELGVGPWDLAESLDGLASVIAGKGDPLRAARIWSAAERLRRESGSPLPPYVRSHYDRYLSSARAALGDDAAFDQAWREGQALSLEQTLELTLAEPAIR